MESPKEIPDRRGTVSYDDDGRPVAVVYHFPPTSPEEDRIADERFAAFLVSEAAARQVAPTLVGLSQTEAQAIVDVHEGVTVEFREPGVYDACDRGGIYACVIDGRVVEAH